MSFLVFDLSYPDLVYTSLFTAKAIKHVGSLSAGTVPSLTSALSAEMQIRSYYYVLSTIFQFKMV